MISLFRARTNRPLNKSPKHASNARGGHFCRAPPPAQAFLFAYVRTVLIIGIERIQIRLYGTRVGIWRLSSTTESVGPEIFH